MASHRISRWTDNTTLQLPTAITAPMTSQQLDAYVMHVRIEELTQKLRMNDVVTANRGRRSPSSEPTYDASGRRTNTRQQRQRQRLEDEGHVLIRTAIKAIPNYRAPARYVSQSTFKEKIYIPVKDFPEKLDTAKELLQDVIETIIAAPKANDRKRQQLRDLAVVNGTFRDDEGRIEEREVAGIAAHDFTPPF
ncbi:Uu.00g031110.m01.CDS01 [Anthostomella pinea]|uniref:Branchpoint-bridging protein n=1 Tax=Anthostomella pinea TaxID=933095 RepID=A0AAI8V3J8_9PEZI|nr:Uu.00g031110.m01.CDS01 [Anthostomella pinea]